MNTDLVKPLLLPKSELTLAKWIEILEKLRTALLPKLPRYKLKTFGELGCLRSRDGGNQYRLLNEDLPETSGPYRLDDHGIAQFRDTGEVISEIGFRRVLHAWGLSKKGEWVTIQVDIHGIPGKREGTIWEKALAVWIFPVDLPQMLAVSGDSPNSVLRKIGMEVGAYAARKRIAAEDAEKFAAEVETLREMILHGFV